jgi:hypothetical protein
MWCEEAAGGEIVEGVYDVCRRVGWVKNEG